MLETYGDVRKLRLCSNSYASTKLNACLAFKVRKFSLIYHCKAEKETFGMMPKSSTNGDAVHIYRPESKAVLTGLADVYTCSVEKSDGKSAAPCRKAVTIE